MEALPSLNALTEVHHHQARRRAIIEGTSEYKPEVAWANFAGLWRGFPPFASISSPTNGLKSNVEAGGNVIGNGIMLRNESQKLALIVILMVLATYTICIAVLLVRHMRQDLRPSRMRNKRRKKRKSLPINQIESNGVSLAADDSDDEEDDEDYVDLEGELEEDDECDDSEIDENENKEPDDRSRTTLEDKLKTKEVTSRGQTEVNTCTGLGLMTATVVHLNEEHWFSRVVRSISWNKWSVQGTSGTQNWIIRFCRANRRRKTNQKLLTFSSPSSAYV
jgi:hypothetical protein